MEKDNQTYSDVNEAILRNIPSNTRSILDVGCGTGILGKKIKEKYSQCKVYGIDNSKEAIILAQTRIDSAYVMNIEEQCKKKKALFEKKQFDVIIFADVLEHLQNPFFVLKYFKKFLKEEGIILISLPNIATWTIRSHLLFGNFAYTEKGILDKTHLHFYTIKTAKEYLHECGLYIQNIDITPNGIRVFLPWIRQFFSWIKKQNISVDEQIINSKMYALYNKYLTPLETSIAKLWITLFAYQLVFITKIYK